eukprot:SAG11_NODE_30608_length_299_cov_1.020000_2_plen_29_part_01
MGTLSLVPDVLMLFGAIESGSGMLTLARA